MHKNEPQILCTAAIGEELLNNSNSSGVHIDVVPLINIHSVTDATSILNAGIPDAYVVFTSANAVNTVATVFHGTPLPFNIFCIGHATLKAVLHYAPNARIMATAPNALELAHHIISNKNISEVVFFCGDIRRDDLPQALQIAGVHVKEVVVYHTLHQQTPITKPYDAILFFSPSAVESFFSVNNAGSKTVFFAIGNTTAAAISNHTANTVVIGAKPDKEELLLLAITYFHQNKNNS